MWLNSNHITVHNNMYILKLKEQLLKIQKLHNKLVIYIIYTYTHTHTHFHTHAHMHTYTHTHAHTHKYTHTLL